jgi:hypothetical protein
MGSNHGDTVSPETPQRPEGFDTLVDQAQQHAVAQDHAYAAPHELRRRRTARIALIAALPVLALVAFWNVSLSSRVTLPPPDIQTIDLARTLLVTAAEIETFEDDNGRLPTGPELKGMLPSGARLTVGDEGFALAVDAPLVGTLTYHSVDEPAAWLRAVEGAVTPEAGR